MTPRDKIRWGIVSTGRIADQFALDMAHVANGELLAVASRTEAAAEGFGRRHRIPRRYGSYDALFRDTDVDAVYIATPHSLHAANTLAAIAAGKHVLCEKPFTIGAAESRRVFDAAGKSSLFVMEGMWTYFLPAVRTALDWVSRGRIGRVLQVRADFGYPMRPFDASSRVYNAELGGGCLLDMGIYPIAIAWLFLQSDPDEIHTVVRKAPNGVDDDVQMLFDYGGNENGCSATLATSFRSKLPNLAYILGEEAWIAIPDFWRASTCRLYHRDECVDHFEDSRESIGLNYETEAAAADMLAGRQQSAVMPWSVTLRLQEHLDRVRATFWRAGC
jgi:predicted dehydrogenase